MWAAERGRQALPGRALSTAGLVLVLAAAGCRAEMKNQPRYKPLAASELFPDGRSARPFVAGTVARAAGPDSAELASASDTTESAAPPITLALLRRGRDRFDIYCSVCHGRTGDADGMIVRRGFPRPPSLHEDRLWRAPLGHLVAIMTTGFGRMPSYASAVPPDDRWAIAVYVRALQRSRRGSLQDVPADVRDSLEKSP